MRSTLFLSLFPSYPTRSAASRGFVLPGVLREAVSKAPVLFSHPNENNIVAKIIMTNLKRSMVFMSLTKSGQTQANATELCLHFILHNFAFYLAQSNHVGSSDSLGG